MSYDNAKIRVSYIIIIISINIIVIFIIITTHPSWTAERMTLDQ